MNKITFKPLSPNDMPLLYQWFQIIHVKQWYARGENFTLKMIEKKYLPRVNQADDIPNYIVYFDDHAVGYVQLYRLTFSLPEGVKNYQDPLFTEFRPEEIAGIDLFVADEGLLGTDFSDRMLGEFIYYYIREKFKAIVVDPREDNFHAIQFFKRNRFEEVSRKNGYVIMIYKNKIN